MAFISKVGNLLKQSVSKHINSELSASNPSIFQAIRYMSSSKLFIGGLSYGTDDTSLREAFSSYGEVIEARVIMDRETGRSRGFGFVSFTSGEEASSAIQAMDGQDLHGRRVRVNYATDRAGGFRSSGGYGGGGGYGSGSGYGGGGYSGGGYGGGNNYGSGGGSYGGGGGSYGSGGGSYGGGASYGSGGGGSYNSGFDSGSSAGSSGGYDGRSGYDGGSGSGNFSVPIGGGSDNYVAGGDSSYASGGHGGIPNGVGNQYARDEVDITTTSEGYGQDDPMEGDFKDKDDEPSDYADKRV